MVSPHSRGWTLLAQRPGLAFFGFPALAGMDRDSSGGPCAACRFPRTRGDGPSHHYYFRLSMQVSPHSRGWTLLPFVISTDT